MATACPTRGPWFGKFIRRINTRMGVIKNQGFRIASKVFKYLLVVWGT